MIHLCFRPPWRQAILPPVDNPIREEIAGFHVLEGFIDDAGTLDLGVAKGRVVPPIAGFRNVPCLKKGPPPMGIVAHQRVLPLRNGRSNRRPTITQDTVS